MIRVIVFIWKIDGISREDFIRYYENNHVPLVNDLLPFYSLYERQYPTQCLYPDGTKSAADAITQLGFADVDAYEAWLVELAKPDVIETIRKDEANFLDSSATQMWLLQIDGTPSPLAT